MFSISSKSCHAASEIALRLQRKDSVVIGNLDFIGGYKKMKNGIHGNRKQLEELSVNRILGELYDKAKAENDGKVHIREIEDGHVGDTIELY